MRQARALAFPICTLIVTSLLVISCSLGKQSSPTRLYTLTALTREGDPQPAGGQGLAIGVGPVELPEYVNRPQIVTGGSENELHRAEFEQWAEPLETNFTRVLAANLATLLRTDRVAMFPWQGPVPLDYQVVVEVTHFLGNPNGSVSLVALWRVLGKDGRATLVSRQSTFTEAAGSQEYGALAAALSRTVASLSRDIATTITTLEQKGSHP
jgi:uncharacterized lipoprotein YmbA